MWPPPQPPGWYPDPRGVQGQAYWDGSQWQFPPQRRQGSRWTVAAIVFGVVVAAIGLLYMSAVGQKAIQKSTSNQSSQSAQAPPPQKPSEVRLNQEGRDGNFAFVVTSVDTAQQTVNVHLTVKNAGNRHAVFWTDNQRLWIGGQWFVPDKAAAAKAGTTSVKLDPGKSATVVLAFEVPSANTAVDHIELHDAALSAGLTVVP